MKYFGTDGIRGEIKTKINDKLIEKVCKGIVLYYKKHNLKKTLLIGNDTRLSGDYILAKLASKLLQNGITIQNLGFCSSPCLAYLTKYYNYPLGLMLSASHNPSNYNGLKFFNTFAEKVDDDFENEFEALMDSHSHLKNNEYARLNNVPELIHTYIAHLKKHIKFKDKFIFDCANGGTSLICRSVFPNQEKINCNPNGLNINNNCGCTHIEMLKKLCIKKQKIGFAFDGDGDRVFVVDRDGAILNGDQILYVLSRFFQKKNDVCVGTIYTNQGLELALKQRNIKLQRTNVGDKNVITTMSNFHSTLGGEDSGHIILKPFMNTGDGVLIAIILANLLHLSKLNLKEVLCNYTEYSQERKNIALNNLDSISSLLESDAIQAKIIELEKQNTKVIIRPSGTEPILRLFVEHKSKKLARKFINELSQLFH